MWSVDRTGDDRRAILLNRLVLYRLLVVSLLLWLTHRQVVRPLWLGGAATTTPLYMTVGGLFLLSLFYLLWQWRGRGMTILARLQCAIDPLLVSVLVVLTGGLESPLHFLFALTVLTSALLLGRREALVVAALALLLSMVSSWLASLLAGLPLTGEPWLIRRFLLHGIAFLLTALLGGHLAARAQIMEAEIQRQSDSLADLALLNRQVVEAMPYGLLTINTQGVIRSANASIGEILDQPAGAVAGSTLATLFPSLAWALEPATDTNHHRELEWHGKTLEVNATPLFDRHQTSVGRLLIIRDISEQRHLEQELKQREQLAFTGRMAATMAHEIRNPLASILSAAQMLPPSTDPQGERLRGIMLDEIGRLKQLTTDFLFFARPPQPQPEAVALVPLLEELALQARQDPRWGGERQLVINGDPALRVWFDPHHLRQVLWNLIANAAQVTPENGHLWMEAERHKNGVILTLTDDGPGMNGTTLGRALEPFFTTRSSGTGLGLAVVAQLMQVNDGLVALGNAPGKGLRVRLTMREHHG